MQAIGNELLRLNPKAKVRYMHSDEYLKTFMATVRNKTWDTFKQQYLHYNLLIIDDIQFISGKDRTMEEFFLFCLNTSTRATSKLSSPATSCPAAWKIWTSAWYRAFLGA